MSKRIFPEHIGPSRAWKQQKRREWKAVLKAIEQFQSGCAYTPAYDRQNDDGTTRMMVSETPLGRFFAATKDVTDALSFKRWGR